MERKVKSTMTVRELRRKLYEMRDQDDYITLDELVEIIEEDNLIKSLRKRRDEIVKAWTECEVKQKRRNGEKLTEEDWNEWDRREKEMQRAIFEIDAELFKLDAI